MPWKKFKVYPYLTADIYAFKTLTKNSMSIGQPAPINYSQCQTEQCKQIILNHSDRVK